MELARQAAHVGTFFIAGLLLYICLGNRVFSITIKQASIKPFFVLHLYIEP